jgi:hypothetical protein
MLTSALGSIRICQAQQVVIGQGRQHQVDRRAPRPPSFANLSRPDRQVYLVRRPKQSCMFMVTLFQSSGNGSVPVVSTKLPPRPLCHPEPL